MFKRMVSWLGRRGTARLLAALSRPEGDRAARELLSRGPEVVPALLGAYAGDTTRAARSHISRILTGMGVAALPELIRALAARVVEVRLLAIETIWQLGDEAEAAVPALVQALGDEHPEVRELLLEALWDLPVPAVRPATPRLMEVLAHGCERNRRLAAELLGRLGAVEALPALEQAASTHSGESARAARAAALGLQREGSPPVPVTQAA